MTGAVEIFTLVTGLLFLLLEIRQSNWMWAVQVLSGGAAMFMFWKQDLYASMSLNLYYVLAAFWGLYSWRRDSLKMSGESVSGQGDIHLRHISIRVLAYSAALQIVGTGLLCLLLERLGDPMTWTDAAATVLSLIATWWLIRTYKEQWLLWIAADCITALMCWSQELVWMTVLYVFYAASAVYGYFHWRSVGVYLQEE